MAESIVWCGRKKRRCLRVDPRSLRDDEKDSGRCRKVMSPGSDGQLWTQVKTGRRADRGHSEVWRADLVLWRWVFLSEKEGCLDQLGVELTSAATLRSTITNRPVCQVSLPPVTLSAGNHLVWASPMVVVLPEVDKYLMEKQCFRDVDAPFVVRLG